MDVGLGEFSTMFGAEPDLAYRQKTADQISRNRRHLENELFFDRLLKAVGLGEAQKLYPPRSNADLRNIYDEINGSRAHDHHKQSLVYYIFKDLDVLGIKPSDFASKVYMPYKYRTFIDGIWLLDRTWFKEAVSCLTDPSLVPTFPEEILYTLCKHNKTDPQIALAYYHAVSPPVILSSKTLDALLDVMAQASLTEAYFFTKTQDLPTQHHLFRRLLSFVHGASGGQIRAVRASELIGLPLNHDEEMWFEEFLIEGKGRALYGAKDTVTMRRIVMGRTGEAVNVVEGYKDRNIDGLSWASLTKGLQDSS